jgi:far upstream element-binding protein
LVGTRHAIDMAKRAVMEKVDAAVSGEGGSDYTGGADADSVDQDSRNRSHGRDGRQDEPYSGGGGGYPRGQPQGFPSSGTGPQQPGAPPSGGEDPYAAYGGYNNYVAMWYAAMAQQQQQQQQQQQGTGEQAGPPGAR